MQIISNSFEDMIMPEKLAGFCEPSKALFIDIETTGLSKETTSLYLIGCGYYSDKGFETTLFFADDESEECRLLNEFSSFCAGFTHMVHFNGLRFDIPYLLFKIKKHGLDDFLENIEQVDIYKLCKPLRYLLFPDSMKQKSIETFLGIARDDKYTGGELIEVYKRYVLSKDPGDLDALITHNLEDVLGMPKVLPILSYLDLYDSDIKYENYTVNSYCDYNGVTKKEVIFSYRTKVKFPKSFTARTETMYVKASAKDGSVLIRLPLYEQDMLLFFDNYRDYRYIPDEDIVIPKELAASLPKDRVKKVTKENCCRRVSGTFLKQPSALFTPVLSTAYKDKKKYFKFPDCFDEKAADTFGRSLINIFFTMKKSKH